MVSHPVPVPPGCPFTLAHIPFGIFSTVENAERRVGAAIGDHVVDISVLEQSSFLDDIGLHHLQAGLTSNPIGRHNDLGRIAALPAQARSQLRHGLQSWLGNSASPLFVDAGLNEHVFVSRAAATMHRPFNIQNFTDFMCADVHVDNCSKLAGAATPPSHYAMPLGYNGRASSVVIDGEPVYRPHGMVRDPKTLSISFQQSQRVDFEVEIGFFLSQPLPRGRTVSADEAGDYIFGVVLLNDWSARDVQFAEMTPLGPFNGKAFATSISPWVTTLDTLQGSKCASPAADLRKGGSTGAAHLRHSDERSTWDLEFEVSVSRPKSTSNGPLLTSQSNLRDLRWSPGQMLAHLASSGCGLSTGDLIGSGTISSPNDSPAHRTLGCLLELTEGGSVPLGRSSDDEKLTFLKDGDVVAMSAWDSARSFGLAPLSSPLLASQRGGE